MDDSAMYTGVDGELNGVFGNEALEPEVTEKIKEQEKLLQELTPKLKEILRMIDLEIESVMSIDRFVTATTQSESVIQAELQAAALYKVYLGNLKTKFTLTLNETRRK